MMAATVAAEKLQMHLITARSNTRRLTTRTGCGLVELVEQPQMIGDARHHGRGGAETPGSPSPLRVLGGRQQKFVAGGEDGHRQPGLRTSTANPPSSGASPPSPPPRTPTPSSSPASAALAKRPPPGRWPTSWAATRSGPVWSRSPAARRMAAPSKTCCGGCTCGRLQRQRLQTRHHQRSRPHDPAGRRDMARRPSYGKGSRPRRSSCSPPTTFTS